jgi:hypothetical protein
LADFIRRDAVIDGLSDVDDRNTILIWNSSKSRIARFAEETLVKVGGKAELIEVDQD